MQISGAFLRKKSSSHSSKLCGFVPLFLLCASCLSQSCVEAWLRFSPFFLPEVWDTALALWLDTVCGWEHMVPDFLFFGVWLRIRTNSCLFSCCCTPAVLNGFQKENEKVLRASMRSSALKWEVATARTKSVQIPWHVLGQILSCSCFSQQEKF